MTPWIVLMIAVVVIVLVSRSIQRDARARREWFADKTVTTGVHTRCEEIGEDDDPWSTIEYRAANGVMYQITGFFDLTPADVGREVEVAYDPEMPSEARIVERD